MNSLLSLFNPSTLSGALLLALAMVIIGLVLTGILKLILRKVIEHDRVERLDRLSLSFLGNLGAFFLWIVLAVIYAHLVPQLDKLGSALLAGAGIASVVIGLAAQSTLGNLVSGISLVLYKPFRKGDLIQITAPTGLETGVVEDMTLGYTVLRTFDNRRIVMANAKIASEVMINLTAIEPRVLMMLPISISYDSDVDRARTNILEIAGRHPEIQEIVGCPLVALGASSVDLSLQAWCSDAAIAMQAQYDLLEEIKKRFDAEGIEIPYSYQNVILRSDCAADGASKE